MAILQEELETFDAHRGELLAKGEGKFVLIHGHDECGIFDTENDALQEGIKRFGLGPFLVKQIVRVELPINIISHHVAL